MKQTYLYRSIRLGAYLTLWLLFWGMAFAWLNWEISPGAQLQYHKNLDASKIPADLPTNFLDYLISTKEIFGYYILILLALIPFATSFLLEALHHLSFKPFLNQEAASFIKMLRDAITDLVRTKSFIIPFYFLFLTSAGLMTIYKDFIDTTNIIILSLGTIILPFGLWTKKAVKRSPRDNPKWWFPSWPGGQVFLLVSATTCFLLSIQFLFGYLGELPNVPPMFLSFSMELFSIVFQFFSCFVVATILINRTTFKKFSELFQKKKAYLAFIRFLYFAVYQTILMLIALLPLFLMVWCKIFFLPLWAGNIREYTPEKLEDYAVIFHGIDYLISLLPWAMLFITTIFYILSGRYIYQNQEHFGITTDAAAETVLKKI